MSSGRITDNSLMFEMSDGGRTGMSFFLGYDEEHNCIRVRMGSVGIGPWREAEGICSTRTSIDFKIPPERAAILFNKGFWTEDIPKVLDAIKAKIDEKNKT